MGTEAETHMEHWTEFPKVWLKSERSKIMSKEVRTIMGTPTETVYLS